MDRGTGKLTIKDIGRAQGLGNPEVRSVEFTPCAWESVFRGFRVGRQTCVPLIIALQLLSGGKPADKLDKN